LIFGKCLEAVDFSGKYSEGIKGPHPARQIKHMARLTRRVYCKRFPFIQKLCFLFINLGLVAMKALSKDLY
jgi:hypothetical protein